MKNRSFWLAWIAVFSLVSAWHTWDRWRPFVHPDWKIARGAGHDLLSMDGLAVYARHPEAQMGPLALVLAQLPRDVYLIAVAAALGLALYLVASGAGWPRGLWVKLTATVIAAMSIAPWGQLAGKGHADDALVIIGAIWMVVALGRGRRYQAVAGFALAMLGKPTGIVLAPALLLDSVALALAAALVTAAIWLPFFVRDPGALLGAGRGIMPVGQGSLPDYLGYSVGSKIPFWVRPVQLLGGMAMVLLGRLRHHLPEMLIAAFAIRALVETNPAPAYSIPIVLLALLPDLRLGLPVFTTLAWAGFLLSQPVLNGGTGLYRIIALLLVLAATLMATFSARLPQLFATRPGKPSAT